MDRLPEPGTRPTRLERVVVIGTSCSGKTTLARRLAAVLETDHIELDAIHWLPGWTERPDDEFRALVTDRTSAARWIVDGNYHIVRDVVWTRATAVVWLNYSFPRVFWRALRRTISRAVTGEELFSGNRESFRQSFLSRDSILVWVIQTHRRRGRQYRALLDGTTYPHLRVVELRNPVDAERFLADTAANLGVAGSP